MANTVPPGPTKRPGRATKQVVPFAPARAIAIGRDRQKAARVIVRQLDRLMEEAGGLPKGATRTIFRPRLRITLTDTPSGTYVRIEERGLEKTVLSAYLDPTPKGRYADGRLHVMTWTRGWRLSESDEPTTRGISSRFRVPIARAISHKPRYPTALCRSPIEMTPFSPIDLTLSGDRRSGVQRHGGDHDERARAGPVAGVDRCCGRQAVGRGRASRFWRFGDARFSVCWQRCAIMVLPPRRRAGGAATACMARPSSKPPSTSSPSTMVISGRRSRRRSCRKFTGFLSVSRRCANG